MQDPALSWAIVAAVFLIGTARWGYQSGVRAERARARAALAAMPPPPAPLERVPTRHELRTAAGPSWGERAMTPERRAVIDELIAMGIPEEVVRAEVARQAGVDDSALRQSVLRALIQ